MAKATFTFTPKEKEALSSLFFGHILSSIDKYETSEDYIEDNLALVTAMNKVKKGITATPLMADYKSAHDFVRGNFKIHNEL